MAEGQLRNAALELFTFYTFKLHEADRMCWCLLAVKALLRAVSASVQHAPLTDAVGTARERPAGASRRVVELGCCSHSELHVNNPVSGLTS